MRADRGAVAAKSDLKLAKWPIFAGRGGPLLSSMVVTTSSRDYYDILGVARTADEAEIKKAFRRLAREHHPDVNQDPGAEDRFKELAEAYEVLSDPERRSVYDRYGREGLNNQGFASDFSGFGSFGDLFSSLFGADIFGARGGPVAQAGDDHLVEASISFVESAHGVHHEFTVDLVAACDTCGGDGGAPGSQIITCSNCGGQGQVQQVVRSPLGQLVRRSACPQCRGAGRVPTTPCPECRGLGKRMATNTLELDIPAGIADGQRIRMPGKAHAGDPGAPNGDLYVEVHVSPDERFMRDELDVVCVLTIPVADAMTGITITVPTVDGDVEVSLAPGTQPFAEHLLKGKGFPQIQGRRRGDQRVVVHVEVPAVTSEAGKALLTDLAAHHEAPTHDKGQSDGLFGRIRSRFR